MATVPPRVESPSLVAFPRRLPNQNPAASNGGFSTSFQATIGRVGTIWALDGNNTQRLMGGKASLM